jgi:hypothetical protein
MHTYFGFPIERMNKERPRKTDTRSSGVPRNFFGGGGGGYARNFFEGVQQLQLRIEGRENGDLGAVAP